MNELNLSWDEFVSKNKINEIKTLVDINKGHALMKSRFAPIEWRITIEIMTLIAIVALPTSVVLFFYIKFWKPILIIFSSFLTIKAIREESAKAVIKYSMENEEFYFHAIHSETMKLYSK